MTLLQQKTSENTIDNTQIKSILEGLNILTDNSIQSAEAVLNEELKSVASSNESIINS